ncbi:hypothetical protein A3H16_03560 [Candidatus Kaiserbacteria bacterium RIFCSPLOWO2_12_FULL_53_8]|uniref:Uncharacterized protein n=2 Tax=Candidatus Kaiseribacteriota TaxID=1752734 RepID=A0A1F6CXQ4_9BACT|nr:MAG: hypothetical protein A2851_01355 [Candidatus Kaiserbacteria bacterium RIFCSPHIGHO2_01_FULL_53_29]OGG91799.1 MAG: hypothetical protein A3H16_03560 [Candidatus Kaiserbacteria bacterium RIFCSPLOWO2_12_FULL_53_8]
MTRRQMTKLVVVFLIVFIISPAVVLAANVLPGQIVPESCNGIGGCQSLCDIAVVAQNVLNTAIYVAVFLSAILFAWAGFLYLTNVGNSGGISKAKEVFFNVAIGLVIILAGWLVVDTLMRTLVGSSTLGPWNKICLLFLQHVSAFV